MHFVDTNLFPRLLQGLSRLWQGQQLTDVTLKADGVQLPCHRVVLAAASPYFLAMFTSGFQESSSPTVEIQTDRVTLKTIIDYVYSAEVKITAENVQNLVQISEQFQFAGLKEACGEYLLHRIDIVPGNCIGFYKLASLFFISELQDKARKVMLTEFKATVGAAEFKEMTETELVEYISDCGLVVPNEDAVFQAVTVWVNYNLPERAAVFERVLAHVRLPHCTSSYLSHVVKNHPLMSTSACHKYLEEAKMFHCLPDRHHEVISPRTTPRKSFGSFGVDRQLVLLGGLTNKDKNNRNCWRFREKSSQWDLLTRIPVPARLFSLCIIRGDIMLMGGFQVGVSGFLVGVTNVCWLFSTAEKKWRSMPNMPHGRCMHAAVVNGDQVYVAGGMKIVDKALDSVSCFDSRTRLWNDVPPMGKKLFYPLAVSFGNSVYVFGGVEENDAPSTTTQQYDTDSMTWSLRAEMPLPCQGGGVATVNDQIFVVGGSNRTCMSYKPASDTWTVLTSPRDPHYFGAAVVWKGKILVGGGKMGSDMSVVEEYDTESDSWSYWRTHLKEEVWCHYLFNGELSSSER